MVVLQPDRFLSELTSMYERSTEKGSVWVTMKRSTLKGKAQLRKMENKGQEVEHRCLVRASNGKKNISTSLLAKSFIKVSLKEYTKFQASYATVLKAHMHALKKRERKDKKKTADAEKAIETAPKKQKKASSKKSSGSKS
ncbi:Signal recognition particle 14 kDa protein [Zea mays]|uniref:Signal recognition particle 14 kDa protein n=2 Tax=Zea mays TaxID=4577 RepID=A0A1D6DYT1_MAIZE|nr:Signal recognition particle 14 kDa protein [Zea mays]ONM13720.1 Signal recognition particle 14 kDa protein [Zea mays]